MFQLTFIAHKNIKMWCVVQKGKAHVLDEVLILCVPERSYQNFDAMLLKK